MHSTISNLLVPNRYQGCRHIAARGGGARPPLDRKDKQEIIIMLGKVYNIHHLLKSCSFIVKISKMIENGFMFTYFM